MNKNSGFYDLFRPTKSPIYLRSADRTAAAFTPICIQNVQPYKKTANKTQKRYDIAVHAQLPQLPVVYSRSSTPIYPLHTNIDSPVTSARKTHVRFNQHKNKTIYINGKDFYQQNDIKNKIWWSPQELSFIRNMFMIEVRKVNDRCPHKTPRECISEIFEKM